MITTPTTLDIPLRTDAGGKIRVGESGVLLEIVIHAFQRGETPESIVESYPTLKLADVYAVLAYYLTHRSQVDRYMQNAEGAIARLEREIEASYTAKTRALRARLRARGKAQ